MRFLVDAQLPPALARWIAANGHDAQHVNDIGLGAANDPHIWNEAAKTSSVLVTKDDDFVQLSRAGTGPALVWVTAGNTSKQVLLDRMAKAFPEIVAALESGERLVELR